jgi:phage terminase small subunit
MGTSLITPKKRGASTKRMTQRMRTFCNLLLASETWDQTAAAKEAGYSSPAQSASGLLKDPRIQALLGKEMREREERCQLKADDVLNFLRSGLFFNPLRLFKPTKDGKWLIENPDDLPEEVGRLIEEMKVKVVEHEDGTFTSMFEIKLVSKATLLTMAMKHLNLDGTRKVEVAAKLGLDWDALSGRDSDEDPITQTIIDV